MTLGTGIDLVEVTRIEESMARFGDRFLKRILRSEEIAYCVRQGRPSHHVAARFAAKEAVSKAFGTGFGAGLGWQDVEISRRDSGEPFVILHGDGIQLLATRQARSVHLSLTHTGAFAVAMAILER